MYGTARSRQIGDILVQRVKYYVGTTTSYICILLEIELVLGGRICVTACALSI